MKAAAVRLSAGRLKGAAVPVPPGVRPTSGRVREALMDSWQARLAGAAVLDLFAGSGAVGLEALGRGAASVLGLEARPHIVELLRASYGRWSRNRAEVRRAVLPEDLPVAVGARRFDLVFADPPYEFRRLEELLVASSELLAPLGELALEHSARVEAPESAGHLRRHRQRRYGESELSFYRREGTDGDA